MKITSKPSMSADTQASVDKMQRIIDLHLEEIERLQREPAWLTVAAIFVAFGTAAALVVFAKYLL
jgi:hypothetical protein